MHWDIIMCLVSNERRENALDNEVYCLIKNYVVIKISYWQTGFPFFWDTRYRVGGSKQMTDLSDKKVKVRRRKKQPKGVLEPPCVCAWGQYSHCNNLNVNKLTSFSILPTVNTLIWSRGHYNAWKLSTKSFPVRIEMLRLMNKMSAKILNFWIGWHKQLKFWKCNQMSQ